MITECEECGGVGQVHHPIKGEGMMNCDACKGHGWLENPPNYSIETREAGEPVAFRIDEVEPIYNGLRGPITFRVRGRIRPDQPLSVQRYG